MPVVSKAQGRLMGAIAGGDLQKSGLSQSKAKEFLRGVNLKSLPARKGKKTLKEAILS
jgi:hypothetical protein